MDAEALKLELEKAREEFAKVRKLEESKKDDKDKDLLAMDAEALKLELEKAREEFAKHDNICKEYERKINKAEEMDKKEAEYAKIVSSNVTRASYKHGVIEGKIRSSETYFNFTFQETDSSYAVKKQTLLR